MSEGNSARATQSSAFGDFPLGGGSSKQSFQGKHLGKQLLRAMLPQKGGQVNGPCVLPSRPRVWTGVPCPLLSTRCKSQRGLQRRRKPGRGDASKTQIFPGRDRGLGSKHREEREGNEGKTKTAETLKGEDKGGGLGNRR